MNKIKKFFTWLKTSPFIKAVIAWVVILVVLALVVDKIALPVFSGQGNKKAPEGVCPRDLLLHVKGYEAVF